MKTSVDALARLAQQSYVDGPYVMRKMMHYRVRICPFERLLPHVAPGSSVLDAGCGAGLFLALLAGTVPEIRGVGFDASGPAIDMAESMAKRVRADLRFIRLDVAEPWPEGRFDVVSLVDVLHHVPASEQKRVVEQAIEKVKPGGVLLYKDMANHPALPALMNRLHDLIVARQWIHYVPIRKVDEWAKECGLIRTHAEEMTRLWYRHELRVYVKARTER